MNKQEKLAELYSSRTTLDRVAKNYCTTPEERKTVKEISMRLFQTQILPLAEELTAELVKKSKELVESNTTFSVQLIDLGLPSGTKWADRNVGANAPEEYGDYFAWGETKPKKVYNKTTYIHLTEDGKYKHLGKNIASTEYDAATANLGKFFCMPTDEQFQELVDKCSWEWTTLNGINGHKITSPNGNHIFLPAAGWKYAGDLGGVGDDGFYWSASPDHEYYAGGLYFDSGDWSCDNSGRSHGLSVRPVSRI